MCIRDRQEGRSVEGIQERDTQDGAGNDIGEHREYVQHGGQRAVLAHTEVGDQDTADHHHHNGLQAEEVGVGDGAGVRLFKDVPVVVQGEFPCLLYTSRSAALC